VILSVSTKPRKIIDSFFGFRRFSLLSVLKIDFLSSTWIVIPADLIALGSNGNVLKSKVQLKVSASLYELRLTVNCFATAVKV